MLENNLLKTLISVIMGALIGLIIHILNKIFCLGGSCPLANNIWISLIYGALVGLLFSLSR
ncbi:MAG: DUF6132 family protein [Endomicrobia bacterium]|nr:DUF6132 family protein [Endomicrobiia bacterium]